MNKEWLQQVKVGDLVLVQGTSLSQHRVMRVTATQIILESGQKFRRTTGQEVGDKPWYYRLALLEPTQFYIEKFQVQQALAYLGQVKWTAIPPAELLDIVENLKARKVL